MEKTCPTRVVVCAAVAALTLAWLTTAQPPAAQPQTPGGQPQTPGFQPQTPGVQPQTPGGQPQTPGLQPQTPGLQPQTPGDQPQTPGAQPQAACSARFEAAVTPKCFDASGVNFTGIIYLLSGNRSGSIPTGYTHQSFVQFICGQEKQDTIIPCVLAQMQEHNTSQCTAEDRAVLFGRGGQLLAFLESICGQPCEQDSTQSLVQCYAAINVNPEHILSQNASIVEDKYTIVGKNDTEFDNFCRNRQKLFSCLGPLSSMCPGLLQRLYLIGIDLQAMETVSGVLCSDKQGYLKGLTCASTPSPDMAQCSQVTGTNMRAAVQGRFQTGSIVPSKYMENLCKTKLTQMACELPAYGKSCDPDAVAVRTSVECGMLPKPCRENAQFQSDYNAVCQKVTTQTPIQVVRPTQGQPGIMPGGGPIPSATSPTVATGKSRSSSADYLRLSTAAFVVTSGVLLLVFT
ncbi:unnamed protein product [Candidula unifasciata]|uniref:Uncharacterized protein n=1 Tax=Candidula unifasciata TaxID=100452 RepID=A0A8S4A985_9EUPU|nr:unnamed protein product [Candidula unifasciata]